MGFSQGQLRNEKRAPGCLGCIEDEILPSSLGITNVWGRARRVGEILAKPLHMFHFVDGSPIVQSDLPAYRAPVKMSRYFI